MVRAAQKRKGRGKLVFGLLLVVAAVLGGLTLFGWGPPPQVNLRVDLPGIGPATPVVVDVAEPRRGLADVTVTLQQGERSALVAERRFHPRQLWQVWAPRTPRVHLQLTVGKRSQPWLVDGQAILRVEAEHAGGLLHQPPPTVVTKVLPVQVTPPPLQVLSSQNNVTQGGCGVVVYRVGGKATRQGVSAGDDFFPGYPLPGRPGVHFALYAAPWEIASAADIHLLAEDALGNRVVQPFVDHFTPHTIPSSTIHLNDAFLAKAVPEIASHTPSIIPQATPLATYLEINGKLRHANRQKLRDLAADSRPRFLWHETFLPFPNAKVMEAFAVRRTYLYQGKVVDHQVHLGFDLASIRHAKVPAANDGVVLWAGYLGIYGNAVILDHGYGLMSLYAHLSSLVVHKGDAVVRGQLLGHTGDTGLAGGDHLHFATLLRGLPVTPLEWWDARWIRSHLGSALGDALPFMRSANGG